MKLLIMPQSLSLCLMRYLWFRQASRLALVAKRVSRDVSHAGATHPPPPSLPLSWLVVVT
jgi:hypothetical protein